MSAVMPEPTDPELAKAALEKLADAIRGEGPVHLRAEGHRVDIVVPHSAVIVLARALESFAEGDGVTVLPAEAELTTQQAADALNVSRPYLIGLLERGEIEYRTLGTHRRVKASSLVAYLKADDARREAAADELSAEAHDLGFA